MKSAPLLDFAPGAAMQAAETMPAQMPGEAATNEPFGAILEEVSGEADIVEEDADMAEDLPALPLEDKKKDEPVLMAPLICFCPPPEIKPPPQISVPVGNVETKTTSLEASVSESSAPNPEVPSLSEEMAMPAPERPLQDMIRLKGESKAAVAARNENPQAIELPPEAFEAIEAVETEAKIEISPKNELAKAPEVPRQGVTNASHGTLVAKLESRVKNTEKTAENAPATEQKMPVPAAARRFVPEVARVESFHAEKGSSHILKADFQAEVAPEIIPVKSLDAVKLVETIRTEVTQLRQRGDVAMSVVLKPDTGTQLTLDISISRDGTVHAQARCERGDMQNLQSSWPQLQQSLAVHGIRMADLSGQNHSQQQSQHQPGAEAFQNFDRGQNPQQRGSRETPAFDEQLAGSSRQFNAPKQTSQTPTPAVSSRRWQSWA